MPLFLNSPYKPGSAEDMTFRMLEDAQARPNPNAGEATAAVATGLGYLLTALFKSPVLLFSGLRRVLAYGILTRFTVIGALLGSALGLTLSLLMHDEILRGQLRLAPLGAGVGFILGFVRVSLRAKTPRA